jgi:hypothetical protein
MVKSQGMQYVDRKDVDYELPDTSAMFSATSNLVPMQSAVQGNRLFLAGKQFPATLPLKDAETPLVQTLVPGSKNVSFETMYGRQVAAQRAPVEGTITSVTPDYIRMKGSDGKEVHIDLYNEFAFNRKTRFHNTPIVKKGDKVWKGQVIASSNYTDKVGTLAMGKNLHVAYMPYKGMSFEDGIVVSDTAAQKLTSEHMVTEDLSIDDSMLTGKNKFVSYFANKLTPEQSKKIAADGVAHKGTVLEYGDPVILALRKKTLGPTDLALGNIHKSLRESYVDASVYWPYQEKGEVVDLFVSGKLIRVTVKFNKKAKVGDKLYGRYGNKGVISAILPDDHMPLVKETGKPIEIILNPLGIASRINPAQVHETLLGKIAKKTGKSYKVPGFTKDSYVDIVEGELKKHGVSESDTITDPITGRDIPNVVTGRQFILKYNKTSDDAYSARDISDYTAEGRPSTGGEEGSKSISQMEMNALLVHGARNNIREIATYKGERNDDFWRAVKFGQPIPAPKQPMIFDKLIASMKGAGINVERRGDQFHLLPLTDKATKTMSSGPIENYTMISTKNFRPEKGGLFDEGITGGTNGTKWSHVNLSEKMPNPIMEEPIRVLLDLTQKEFEEVLAGRKDLNGKTGTAAIESALHQIKVPEQISRLTEQVKTLRGAKRDKAIKKLNFLAGVHKFGVHPADFMLSAFPVLPPAMRPISVVGGNTQIVSNANYLYADLVQANNNLRDLKKDLPDKALGQEKLNLYQTMKAVSGLADPLSFQNKQKNIKGFLEILTGPSPASSYFQQKVIRKQQDLVGRSVIIPDPDLNMDEVGIPEDTAWHVFKPFVFKKLRENGYKSLAANDHIDQRSDVAKKALLDVMATRPVFINRAPTLHKFNIMAGMPKLRAGRALAMSPIVEPGFNADHDGDQLNIHVPVTEEARKEAIEKMLPSKNLFSIANRSAMYTPIQEAGFGLYKATNFGTEKVVAHFKTAEEALKAYRAGKIKIDDKIVVDKM